MLVAIDAGPLYGHRTGIGVATAAMIGALGERDDVELRPFVLSGRVRPQPGHRRLPIPGIVASQLWSRTDRPSVDRLLGDCDLVHGTNYVLPPTRRPAIVSVYDCWFLRHPELASPIVRRAGLRLRRAIARGALVHACSAATEQAVRELLATDRVVHIPLGPPPAAASDAPRRRSGAPYIVAVGTEERRKAIPLLVAAFAVLASSAPELRLVLAGAAGDDTPAIDRAVAGLPGEIAGRIDRLGAVDEATKHSLVRGADAVVYPSLDEGFGFPVLEAQQAGTPVVASAVGAIPEIAGDAAVLVTDRTPDAFATAILNVLDDGVLRLTLIEAGMRNTARFDWADTAARLADAYRGIADG